MARVGCARTTVATVALALLCAACARGASDGAADLPDAVRPAPLVQSLVGGTGSSDGSHRVPATGVLADATVVDVPLDAMPAWVVGGATESSTWWVVVGVDGAVRGIQVPDADPAAWVDVPVQPSRLAPGAPPVLQTVAPLRLVEPPTGSAPLTAPMPLLPRGVATVLDDGDLAFVGSEVGSEQGGDRFALGAPPDARLAVDPVTGAMAVATGATVGDPHRAPATSWPPPASRCSAWMGPPGRWRCRPAR